jgi:two-component system OmpR family sensor kinase
MARRALTPTSLRWRLTAWVAGVMLVSAAVIFFVIYQDTGTQLQSQIERDLKGDTTQQAQSLGLLAGKSPAQVAAAARRYVRAQPYRATSTLLFASVPGAGTVSNHPELFTGAGDVGESTADQARENALAHALLIPHLGYSTRVVPDVGRVRILERSVKVGRLKVLLGAGQPLEIVERAQQGVLAAVLIAGLLTLALALLASYLAGARVSAPLRRMATVAARVDAGDLGPRMAVSTGRRDEVHVLAEAFNHMLDRLADAFAAQREFVADASHELRTPLTVVRGQLEVLAAQDSPTGPEVRRTERLVQAEITRITRLVDDLLLLAQSEQINFLRTQSIELGSFVEDLWDGLSLTADRRFEVGAIPPGMLLADPDRLAQALRNLARNAIEHTQESDGLVRLDVTRVGRDRVCFAVSDDGPGIPPEERDRVFDRFHRTDPARNRSAGGAGLGLAIVRAIAEAHGGHVVARANQTGPGARLELTLPGFRPGSAEQPPRKGSPRVVSAQRSS